MDVNADGTFCVPCSPGTVSLVASSFELFPALATPGVWRSGAPVGAGAGVSDGAGRLANVQCVAGAEGDSFFFGMQGTQRICACACAAAGLVVGADGGVVLRRELREPLVPAARGGWRVCRVQ